MSPWENNRAGYSANAPLHEFINKNKQELDLSTEALIISILCIYQCKPRGGGGGGEGRGVHAKGRDLTAKSISSV